MLAAAVLLLAAQAAVPSPTRDHDATPAEYGAAMPGEQFARAVVEVCTKVVAADGSFAGIADVAQLPDRPSFLADYPPTIWYALQSAPRNVFLSIDAAPGKKRCRVVLANNVMGPAAHLWTSARLQRAKAHMVSPFAYVARRDLNESVWALPNGPRIAVIMIQTPLQPEQAGRGHQATATVTAYTIEEGRSLGVAF